MVIFLTRLFSGAEYGSLYSLIALTLVVVFRTSATINFAQGEMALFTAYVSWWLNTHGLSYLLTLPLVIVLGFAIGATAERLLVRPVGRRSDIGALLVCLGLFTALNGLDGALWGSADKPFSGVLPTDAGSSFTIGGALLPYATLVLLVVLAAVVTGLVLLLERTRFGLQMRAVASNRDSAELSGVDVSRVMMVSWGLAAGIGSLAGVLLVPILPPNTLSLATMFPVLVYGAAAALLGGLTSIKGAVVGGLGLSIAQAMVAGYGGSTGAQLQLTIAMAVIVGVLLLRPTGLFGAREATRV